MADRRLLIIGVGNPDRGDDGAGRAVIKALASGNADRAVAVMNDHLEAVASRALIVARPQKSRDLKDILAPYAEPAENTRRKATRRRAILKRQVGDRTASERISQSVRGESPRHGRLAPCPVRHAD